MIKIYANSLFKKLIYIDFIADILSCHCKNSSAPDPVLSHRLSMWRHDGATFSWPAEIAGRA
jgi:hypothetical protein